MAKLYNRAGVSTATSGTGTITLGSAIAAGVGINSCSFLTFANAGAANGEVVRYLILDSNGAWEYGTGTYTTAGTTLSRTLGASSTGSLLSLSGSAQVFITAIAEDLEGKPNFSAYNGSSQTPSLATWTEVNHDTENYDTGAFFDTTDHRFTPLVAGKYLFVASAHLNSTSPASNPLYGAAIAKNGTRIALNFSVGDISITSSETVQSAFALLSMNGTTDYVEAQAYIHQGTSPSIQADSGVGTYFFGYMVGQ